MRNLRPEFLSKVEFRLIYGVVFIRDGGWFIKQVMVNGKIMIVVGLVQITNTKHIYKTEIKTLRQFLYFSWEAFEKVIKQLKEQK